MGFPSVTSRAHQWMATAIRPGDIVVDATVGNGVDTLFLAMAVGPAGTVYGFDIQQEALDKARKRIAHADKKAMAKIHLILRDHADMAEVIPKRHHGQIGGIMFNFGYLPGGDPAVITRTETSLKALDAAACLLKSGGTITAVLYPGHPGGDTEAEAVRGWAAALPKNKYQSVVYEFINQGSKVPVLLAICKK